ncbi:MAG: hypothetical protein ABWX84_03000 [Nocardioides sp.]
MTTWHAHPNDLAAYVAGADDPVLAASVETHLLRCADCRTALASAAGTASTAQGGPERSDTERRWDSLAAVVDTPRSAPLARLGVSTRPLRAAWLLAAFLVLLVPVVLAFATGRPGLPTVLLALAPIAPSLAVVVAYRTSADPAGEMALAVPVAGLRIVSARALLVALAAAPLGVAAALALQLPLAVALGWLLPGLALSSLVLLAGTTRLDPAVVAGGLGILWALAVGTPAASRRASVDAVVDTVAGAPVQLLALAIAVSAIALTVSRREQIAYRSHT